jgi:ADP-heptose:LPS heptosyltransferase
MKFLVIRFSSIGDIVLTTPVVRCLKQQVPGAVIHFLTKENFGALLAHNPYIDRIHFLQEDFGKMMEALRAEKFDAVIDLHRNIRTLRVKKALGLPSHSFRKLNLEKWLITSLKWDRLPDIHIVDRYLDTLASYGVKNDGQGLDYFMPPATRSPRDILPEHFLPGYTALVTGAAHATKRIPVEKMRDICDRLDCPVVLLGGPGDRETAEVVSALDPRRIFNACGSTSLHESASLVKGANLVISSDTGLMHIAAAMKRPLIVLWGNTIPGFGMYPYYGSERIPFRNLEVAGLSCRPCSKIGYAQCPKKHFRCMREQSPDQVAALVREYWSASP